MNEVTWVCESCSTENVDLRSETAMPMCAGCEQNFDWNQDAYLNLIDDLSLKLYGKPACELLAEPDAAIHCLQDAFNSNIKAEEALKNIRLKQAQVLWSQLGDIPVNDEGEIEEAFLDFEIGEDRETIWHYFEDEFNCSVAEDLMFPKAS